MPQEIELKLDLPARLAPSLRGHPLLRVLPCKKRCIRNIYIDTPELHLSQARMAVRRRLVGGKWLLTVKTADDSVDGLSRRLEWEYPQAPDSLDFTPVDRSDIRAILEQLSPRLTLAFRTDFVRTSWQIPFEDSRIELALDIGHIRTQQRREHIHEVELELLAGDETALQKLADTLRTSLPLPPLAPSKAVRGYALLASAP